MSTRPPAFGVRARAVERAHVVAPAASSTCSRPTSCARRWAERPEGCDIVVLDLRGLTFFDTSGMRLVVETLQELARTATRFAILRGSQDVQRLFALARLEDRLPFFDDLDGALAA